MIFYSIAPILGLEEQQSPQAISAVLPIETIPFKNGFLQGTKNNDGFQISRIISTDPSVYLDGNFDINKTIKL